MRGRAQQTCLQVAPHAVGDGQRENERRHARRDAEHGDAGDQPNDGLPALGTQVAQGDERFKSHRWFPSRSTCHGLHAYGVLIPVEHAHGNCVLSRAGDRRCPVVAFGW